MKKILALAMLLCVVFCIAACSDVMTHDEFMAAKKGDEVTVEAYVQAKQGWWNDQAVVYLQGKDGGYFVYSLPCTKAEYDDLVTGTKVKVVGTKDDYKGMNEINPATSFEIISGDTFVATPTDVTAKFANADDLVAYQGMLVEFKDMTVVKVEYNNGEPGDDIYVTIAKGEVERTFTVEVYLTGTDTDVYEAVGTLKAGDVVDVEGFVQWWDGPDLHITKVTK